MPWSRKKVVSGGVTINELAVMHVAILDSEGVVIEREATGKGRYDIQYVPLAATGLGVAKRLLSACQ